MGAWVVDLRIPYPLSLYIKNLLINKMVPNIDVDLGNLLLVSHR